MMSSFEVGAHNGIKRPAPTEESEGEQRLSKRLHGLSLGNGLHLGSKHHERPVIPAHVPPPSRSPAEERMHLDDTKDKVYIHDLDAELAELEGNDEQNIDFLPDIEKKLAAFPSLLETKVLSPSEGQLVLYKPISFPDEIKHEQRKVIIQARRKAKEEEEKRKLQAGSEHIKAVNSVGDSGANAAQSTDMIDDDPDAMEIE
ncbi:hypothetical protein UCRPC4_g01572 [Phaeomoniella chlamydospora]|uniref:Uncharacterized protein n=1 Tax=Phaeomoniella chlamydospora TaxID=158046 RepID=A0A0G2HBQ2_PHACM|nr:hypothetical protein UCRPC4_g01572 [Phaeomoniella chlamydospora]